MPFLRSRPGPLRSNLLGARRLQRLQGSGKKALSLGIYFFSFFFFSYWYLSLFFRGEKKPPKTNQPPKNPKHTQRPPRTESPGRYLSNARNTERSVISVGRLFVKRPAAAAGGSPTKGALRAGPTPPRCGSRRSPPPRVVPGGVPPAEPAAGGGSARTICRRPEPGPGPPPFPAGLRGSGLREGAACAAAPWGRFPGGRPAAGTPGPARRRNGAGGSGRSLLRQPRGTGRCRPGGRRQLQPAAPPPVPGV